MALESTDWYFKVQNDAIIEQVRYPRPSNYGPASVPPLGPDPGETFLWYQEWRDDGGAQPGQYYDRVPGTPAVVGNRVETVDTWVEWTAERKRTFLQAEINEQVPIFNATEMEIDKGKQGDVARTSSAANDKQLELQETADQDLDAFDSTLDVHTPNQDGHARWTITITDVTPWAGAPDNDLGWYSELDIQTDFEDQGGEARIQIISGPDAGAVLPFTQDPTNPKLWTAEARDGHKWADPNTEIQMQLLWGAGSLKVSPVMKLDTLYERKATMVRYGTATAARRSRI